MISIYDVLKANKGLPVRDPIAYHWGRKLGGGAAEYGELTDVPPLTFTANGRNLVNYRIYGANDGVGEQTENIVSPATWRRGFIDTATGNEISDLNSVRTDFIKIDGIAYWLGLYTQGYYYLFFYDINQNYLQYGGMRVASGVVPPPTNAKYIRIGLYNQTNAPTISLTTGSTAPAQYIPFGYQINAEVGDGVTTTNTTIYIGNTPLAQGEYVDYSEQKVYKYVGGVLTPTDPPVALPALPTIDGATIVDFDNTPKPSEVYIKYPK